MSSTADIVELKEERARRGSSDEDSFETAGAMLRAAREARGLSVEEVAEATNIREAHIVSIEEMAIDRLPVAAYTSGFVRAYAELLELPVQPMINRFREEAGYQNSGIAPKVNMPRARELSGGRELSLLAVVAILGFIIWVAWQVFREAAPEGPVQIAGTPLQERPIDPPEATFGGANEVPVARPEPNPDITAIDGVAMSDREGAQEETTGEGETAIADASPLIAEAAEALEAENAAAEQTPIETDPQLTPAQELNQQALAEATEAEAEPVEPEAATSQPTVDATETALSEEPSGAGNVEAVDEAAAQQIVGQAAPDALQALGETDQQVAPEEVVYTEPSNISRVSPIYPRRCERLSSGTETVVVTYDISSRGQPVNTRVTESTNECFNAAAISAVGRWRFEPATRNGSPIPAYTRSTRFRFDLPQ